MGGKALRNCKLRRYVAADYDVLQQRVLAIVSKHFDKYDVPRFLPTKKDFGDVDVVVCSAADPPEYSRIVDAIAQEFGSKEIVRNGPVCSLEFEEFQVDLIKTRTCEEFRMTVSFMSLGDLGTLVGVIAKKMGMKFGQLGFQFPVYAPASPTTPVTQTSFLDDPEPEERICAYVTLSTDMREILNFMGFDSEKWTRGFEDELDVFNFVTRGLYFDPNMFATATIGTANRRRLKNRPMFDRFLKHIADIPTAETVKANSNIVTFSSTAPKAFKDSHRHRALQHFPQVVPDVQKIEQTETDLRLFRHKFNGSIVSELTGLTGKSLGKLMVAIRQTFSDRDLMTQYILAMSEEELKQRIMDVYEAERHNIDIYHISTKMAESVSLA
ncbi:hypothetical protein HK102_001461 [Quaeritorhiza haematococci]|nr:hypothetical protein HK102_001461 [Quaeritorhiza haematococci]